MVDAWEKLQVLELYATPHVSSLATKAWEATGKWGRGAAPGKADEEFNNNRDTSENAKIALREAIRADLGVPTENTITAARPDGDADSP